MKNRAKLGHKNAEMGKKERKKERVIASTYQGSQLKLYIHNIRKLNTTEGDISGCVGVTRDNSLKPCYYSCQMQSLSPVTNVLKTVLFIYLFFIFPRSIFINNTRAE